MNEEERSFFLERERENWGGGGEGRNGLGNVIFLGGGGLVEEVVGGLGTRSLVSCGVFMERNECLLL